MARDWAAVAAAMKARMDELDMTQVDLARRSRLAPMTIREVLRHTVERHRSPQTLAALSEALGCPPGYLQAIAEGRNPGHPDLPDTEDPVLAELATLKEAILAINARLDAIEQQQAGGGGQS
jgi:transcriptional regulator with XRE-family HTH domain